MSNTTERHRGLYAADPAGKPARLVDISIDELDEGDVTIAVEWSSMNYKDALAITGQAPIARRHPMIAGIDLAGRVIASTNDSLAVGTDVLVAGSGLSEEHDGGYTTVARVPAAWCVPIPANLDGRRAMALGTAGLTAMLSIMALEQLDSAPSDLGELPLVVTGAAGGVGSIAVMLAAKLGYHVLASTGRLEEEPYLRSLGAGEILDRNEISEAPSRPMGRARFGAAIDVVGGNTLANIITVLRPGGTVTACGLAGGAELATTVHPFILRGVTLAGINSVFLSAAKRNHAWELLGQETPLDSLDSITTTVTLDEVIGLAPQLLEGKIRGRVVVAVGAS